MLADEVENYLREVTRVLKTGGRCLISFFLLNDESSDLIDHGKSIVLLTEQHGPARTLPGHKPEFAVGFDEAYVIDLYEQSGLEIKNPIVYGWWCGRANFASCQDQIVAYKKDR